MTKAVVQHHAEIKGNNVPGSSNQITLGSALTPGNLLVCAIGCNCSTSAVTVNTAAGWFVISTVWQGADQGNLASMLLGRYVQSGDSNTVIPAPWSSGSTWWAYSIYEISGCTGTVDVDVQCAWGMRQGDPKNPPLPCLTNGSVALAFFSSYDGSGIATIDGSWTADEGIANSGNYGSMSSASRTMGAGDVLDGTWSGFNANPNSGYGVILAPSAPGVMTFRNVFSIGGHASTFGMQLPADPTPGNLIVAWMTEGRGDALSMMFDTGWTKVSSLPQGSVGDYIGCAYKYVTTADLTNARSFTFVATGGNFFFDGLVVEFSGTTGVWTQDFQTSRGFAGSASRGRNPETTSGFVTNSPNQLAVCYVGVYDSSGPDDTISSGWQVAGRTFDSANAGWFQLIYQYVPAGGTNVTATFSYQTNDVGGYFMMGFGSGTGTSSGGGGGGPEAINRFFPVGLNVRAFPLDSSRFFPRA